MPTIAIHDVPITYHVAGNGPPLVLVHGLSGSTQWWGRNIPALARHFRVYAIDLIGFGENCVDQPFVLNEAARFLVAWMDCVGVGRAAFVGHSMGGYIVTELAADHPARVERLVLVDAAGLPFGLNLIRHAGGLLGTLRALHLDFVPTLLYDAARAGPLTLLSAILQILTSDLQAKLAQVRAPTLVIWGARDRLIPVEVGRQLCAALPHAEFLVLPDAGHNPMWESPQRFNQALLRFLRSDSQV